MAIVNHAYNKYNQATPKTQIVKGVPRHKFNFTASFNYGAEFDLKHLELDKIASITMPSWTSSAITMNAYNAKKVVQTNYEYYQPFLWWPKIYHFVLNIYCKQIDVVSQ